MNEFKSPMRVIGGAKGSHCFYPVQIDMAGKGCTGGCAYCYAKGLLEFRGHWNPEEPAVADINKVRKLFENAFDKEKDTKDAKALRECDAIRIGGMTDPFFFNEEGTYELLKLCDQYDKKYVIFTKSPVVANTDIIDVMNPDLAYVQMSVASWNDGWNRQIESGTLGWHGRVSALYFLSEAGIPVAARIAPIVPDSPFYDPDFFHIVCRYHPDTIIAETMRYNPHILKSFEARGFNMQHWIPDDVIRSGSTIFYSVETRKRVYDEIFLIASEYGIEFSVCETDHFEEFKDYWNNPNDCCNAPWSAQPTEFIL